MDSTSWAADVAKRATLHANTESAAESIGLLAGFPRTAVIENCHSRQLCGWITWFFTRRQTSLDSAPQAAAPCAISGHFSA